MTTLESPQDIEDITSVEWQGQSVAAKAIQTGFPPQNVLLVWDVITGKLVNLIPIAEIIRGTALHPTEDKVVYGTESLTPVAVDILPSPQQDTPCPMPKSRGHPGVVRPAR